jgi:hypothetical protein
MMKAIEVIRIGRRRRRLASIAAWIGLRPANSSSRANSVFSGMIGVTAFGLFLTPVFYVLLRSLSGNARLKQHAASAPASGGGPSASRSRLPCDLCERRPRRAIHSSLDRRDVLLRSLSGNARLKQHAASAPMAGQDDIGHAA